jgi:peptide/nickel transport system permease protein
VNEDRFVRVGIRPEKEEPVLPGRAGRRKEFPFLSAGILSFIFLGCLLFPLFIQTDPAYLDLAHANAAPSRAFPFGTDALGRDLFAMIWHGGRISLWIGFAAAAVSTGIALVWGSASGLAPAWADALLMRLTDILLSIPSLILVLFLQALLGEPSALSLSLVIGLTGWADMAKVIRTEARQIRGSGYVTASRCMGGGFFHILWRHLTPNFISSILFMVVMSIRSAMAAEATLSFMGLGLPLETVSWGGMLALSERAFMTASWWVLWIPGGFLTATLLCVTQLGNYLRGRLNQKQSNL